MREILSEMLIVRIKIVRALDLRKNKCEYNKGHRNQVYHAYFRQWVSRDGEICGTDYNSPATIGTELGLIYYQYITSSQQTSYGI
jgi:hypothetical protein